MKIFSFSSYREEAGNLAQKLKQYALKMIADLKADLVLEDV